MADLEGDLSQIAELSRGSADTLREEGIHDLRDLSPKNPGDGVFGKHQQLRARRTVMPQRAKSLVKAGEVEPTSDDFPEELNLVDSSGTSAVMPKWPDLQVYLFVEFDLSSAISFCFGAKAFWMEPSLDEGYQPTSDEPQDRETEG
jgi:hypothetical protein